jgi:hypothetical protein
MIPVFIDFSVLVFSFLVLRRISLKHDDSHFSGVGSFFVGLLAWIFLLAVSGWGFLGLYLAYLLLSERVLGAIFGLIFIGMASGFAFQANEVLDTSTVVQFVRRALVFRPTKPHSLVFEDELEKKRVRDIHAETSGRAFPTIGAKKRLLTKDEVQRLQQEAMTPKERPPRSMRFEEEVQRLKTGQLAHLTDPWKIYNFSQTPHELYAEMYELEIDPRTRTFQFRLNIHNATEMALQDPMFVFELKQDLYQLLQVLNTDPWLGWYSEFFDHIVVVCFGNESDAFGHMQMYPILRIDIVRSQLTDREGKFFNAADLQTICAFTFANGKPLPEELL